VLKNRDIAISSGAADGRAPAAASGYDPAVLADPALVVLRDGARCAVVAPALGGSLAAFYDDTPHGPLHWLRPTSRAALAAGDPLQLASFPLLPYCNRIRDGRFRFGGRTWHLPMGEGLLRHALHGQAWRTPWQVDGRSARTVDLVLRYAPPQGAGSAAQPGWPFAYEARQRIELAPQGLSIRLGVRNTGSEPMPFGFGHHPYYPRSPQTLIETRVQAMWHADADLLPAALGPAAAVDALRRGLAPRDHVLDNNFVGWSREAVIRWPDEHRQLTLRADAPLDFFVLYTPAGEPFFCAEPVSNTTDWLNLDAAPAHKGGGVLAPGATANSRVAWLPATAV
jgi:aldose 1-epimerase